MRSVNPMTALILHFDQVKKTHRNQVGGKGYALSQLSRAGFPVPMGFVVTIDAFRTHTAVNGLDALVTEALIGDDPSAASARIGTAFEAAETPSAIVASICQAYLALGEGEVAVRSSALRGLGIAGAVPTASFPEPRAMRAELCPVRQRRRARAHGQPVTPRQLRCLRRPARRLRS